jgi:hypothetical protein
MKKIIAGIIITTLFSFRGCTEEEMMPIMKVASCDNKTEVIESYKKMEGTVDVIAGIWVINLKNDDKEIICAPCNLPNNLKIVGKEILFDASILRVPSFVRMVGQPIEMQRVY